MATLDPSALWAQALSDPSVTAGKSGLTKAIINAYLGYGNTDSLFATDPASGQSLASTFGVQPSDVAAAQSNPFSTLHALRDRATQETQSNITGLAGRGLEFSGAAAAMAENAAKADQARQYQAQQGLSNTISDIGGKYTGLISGAYSTLMGNALNDPTIPAAPAPDAAGAPAPITPAPQTTFNYGLPPAKPINYGPQNGKITVPKPLQPKISLGHV